jgi:hypothetical protein
LSVQAKIQGRWKWEINKNLEVVFIPSTLSGGGSLPNNAQTSLDALTFNIRAKFPELILC